MENAGESNVLIVTHGPGRGREVPTGKVFLDRLQARDPSLADRIRIHSTGSGAPDLSSCSLVLFWLGDPLRQKYPECYAEAVAIAHTARSLNIPILNDPDALSNTSKSVQASLWSAAGIPSAKARYVSNRAELFNAMTEIGKPCILRSNEEHAQRNVLCLETPEDALRVSIRTLLPGVVIETVDVRAAHRGATFEAETPFTRYHHKARAFVFRDRVKASHLLFAEDMIVGVSNCIFKKEGRRRNGLIRLLGHRQKLVTSLIEKDMAYYSAPIEHEDVLSRSLQVLGLDFAAIDYSILPDGTPVLWEANPYFYLPPGEESVLFRERQAVRRVNESLDWMAVCLREALAERAAKDLLTPTPGLRTSTPGLSGDGLHLGQKAQNA